MFKTFIIFICLTSILACRKENIGPLKTDKLDFVVTGHAYGNPLVFQWRLYAPLVPVLGNIAEFVKPDKFIFTGDVVATPNAENWKNVLQEFDSLGIDYWIAPGNHDIATDYFLEEVQSSYFLTERKKNNLFLILNTNFHGWTVDAQQVNRIETELNNLEGIQNVFVFTHHVWWSKLIYAHFTDMDTIVTNSDNLIFGPSNFWIDAFDLFENLELPVYFFAGDVGAYDFVPAYSEQHFDNFHFYTSGVGGGVADNILYVQVSDSGKVQIKKINF
ncbi:hypothetical protein DNU06_12330 [Putridiphycobacter roseus]|uniref:Calcineurin-like phosphoesterase domain-containing protein n=1 Tax=Putridiphycobacter roseus TaxID=2219161 RepID=A0A2W1NBE9_9FLAO|nr:metallophosphoesterase [Putridiphycobacter roseus]PZE16635.1 hypothetical protein DNU06_12330 [Putridiphycobacter roseus]